MNEISARTENLYFHPFVVTNAVYSVERDVNLIHKHLLDVRIAVSKSEIKEISAKIDAVERQIYENFDIIDKQFLGDKSLVKKMKEKFAEWKPLRDDIIHTVLEAQNDTTKKYAMTQYRRLDSRELVAEIKNFIKEFEGFAQAKAKSFYDDSQILSEEAEFRTYIILFFALIIAIILGIYITRSITSGTNKLVFASKQISEGNFDVNIDINQKDEIGILAATFKEMVLRLRKSVSLAKKVSKGDLTGIVDDKKFDGKGDLDEALLGMLTQLREITIQITESANNVALGSTEISSTANVIAQGASEQASSTEEVSTSIEEMTASIQQNNENALQTEKLQEK